MTTSEDMAPGGRFIAARTVSGNDVHLAFRGHRTTFCGVRVASDTGQPTSTVTCDRCCKPGKGVRAGQV